MNRRTVRLAVSIALFIGLVVVTLARDNGGDGPGEPPPALASEVAAIVEGSTTASQTSSSRTPRDQVDQDSTVASATTPKAGDETTPTGTPPTTPLIRGVVPPDDAVTATVQWVSDGDTLTLDIAPGGDGSRGQTRSRLLRIDTPEIARDGAVSECGADAATQRLTELAPPGATVVVDWDIEPLDQYGRDLVHVWTLDGVWINGQLVAEGHAAVVTFRPNVGYDAEVRALQQAARTIGAGSWGAC